MEFIWGQIITTASIIFFLRYYFKWIVARASLNKPRTDQEGHPVLYYGIPMFLPVFGLFAIAVFMLMIPLPFLSPASQPSRLIDWLLATFGALVFLIPGIIFFFALKVKVILTERGIISRAAWPWHPKEVFWDKITKVTYSPLSQSFVIDYPKYRTLRISPLFYGIVSFCQNLEEHIGVEKYEEARKVIQYIYGLSLRDTNIKRPLGFLF